MWVSNSEFDDDLKSIEKLDEAHKFINKKVKELCRISQQVRHRHFNRSSTASVRHRHLGIRAGQFFWSSISLVSSPIHRCACAIIYCIGTVFKLIQFTCVVSSKPTFRYKSLYATEQLIQPQLAIINSRSFIRQPVCSEYTPHPFKDFLCRKIG